jgi:hypothetical protein
MKAARTFLVAALSLTLAGSARATTYGSVEPIANPSVVDTTVIKNQKLSVRKAIAERFLGQCRLVDRVIEVLTESGTANTLNSLNTHFEVGAGGFMGETNPAFVYTIIDDGPNGASKREIKILTDSLGYVMSQGSAFLLDADNPSAYDFEAKYVVVNFSSPPPLEQSAAFFEHVGEINPLMFETDTSGYTQFGRAYLSLQSDIDEQDFIDGYVEAAGDFDLQYTPVEGGVPGLFTGGAGFPGNDWTGSPNGEDYLDRIPPKNHEALAKIRNWHLKATRAIVKARGKAIAFPCR